MYNISFKLTILSFIAFVFVGCGSGSSVGEHSTPVPSTTPVPTAPPSDNNVHITQTYQVERLALGKPVSLNISIDTPESKSLYLILSNYNTTETSSVSISQSNKRENVYHAKVAPHKNTIQVKYAPKHVQTFNKKLLPEISHTLKKSDKIVLLKSNAQEGDAKRFYLDAYSSGPSTQATLRKVISSVTTQFGIKTLNIWVSDNAFGSGCSKSKCVTQEMIDALSLTFLRAGENNDIYDWVTNIYGEEWGSDAQVLHNNLIGKQDQIDILLTDIDNDDSTTGGVIGYFYSKDNYDASVVSGSNECIMFYIDSVLFANGNNGTWNIDDFWPKETVSTLVHEFQHMIHFYQKTVLFDVTTDTWINEMLSETTEDVLATKIKHTGPRGVPYTDGSAGEPGNTNGRYPLYNASNNLSLTVWDNRLENYSVVNAFGAFLTRNYGGSKLLHDIVHNKYGSEDAVMEAIHKTPEGEGKTFNDILREWGVAVMLSDHTDLENTPKYNTGDFIFDHYGESTYELGSIDFFNYDPQPMMHSAKGTVKPQSNYFYKIGDNLKGTIQLNIELSGQTEATLIAK